jgi:hypothetical protein
VTPSNSLVLGSIANLNGCDPNGTPACLSTMVGIGTTAPQYTLDVHGTANFTGPVTFATSTMGNTLFGNNTAASGNSNGGAFGSASSTGSGVVGTNSSSSGGYGGYFSSNRAAGYGMWGVNTSGGYAGYFTGPVAVTGNETVGGNLTASGVVTGSSFQIGSNQFAFGSSISQNAFGFAGNSTTSVNEDVGVGYQSLAANTSGPGTTPGLAFEPFGQTRQDISTRELGEDPLFPTPRGAKTQPRAPPPSNMTPQATTTQHSALMLAGDLIYVVAPI